MSFTQVLQEVLTTTGFIEFARTGTSFANSGLANLLMIVVGLILVGLAITRQMEPLLLLPIGIGAIFANIPGADPMMGQLSQSLVGADGIVHTVYGGFMGQFYEFGLKSSLFPLLVFFGVGAMIDFAPLIADPKMLLLGAVAQIGIFGAFILALMLSNILPFINFSLAEAASIAIIGSSDGPTTIYTTTKLAPDLLGAVAIAAYSYMALLPIIQPPIMRLLTTKEQRKIKMKQLRNVTTAEKILFPIIVIFLTALFFPTATPLVGALMFGNLCAMSNVVKRLTDTMTGPLINIVTIFLGLAVGSRMQAGIFLTANTLGIIALGLFSFMLGTAAGVLGAQLMRVCSKTPINPLIGSAAVSAMPMAARVSQKIASDEDPNTFILMHAMAPNVASTLASAAVAGVFISLIPKLAGG
jgi:oxaloacetate decarboxylase beta subunit